MPSVRLSTGQNTAKSSSSFGGGIPDLFDGSHICSRRAALTWLQQWPGSSFFCPCTIAPSLPSQPGINLAFNTWNVFDTSCQDSRVRLWMELFRRRGAALSTYCDSVTYQEGVSSGTGVSKEFEGNWEHMLPMEQLSVTESPTIHRDIW